MYLCKISTTVDQQPEWFRSRLLKVLDDYRVINRDQSWVWVWNETYDRKICIKEGAIQLVFENEQDYFWFSLGEL